MPGHCLLLRARVKLHHTAGTAVRNIATAETPSFTATLQIANFIVCQPS